MSWGLSWAEGTLGPGVGGGSSGWQAPTRVTGRSWGKSGAKQLVPQPPARHLAARG